MAGRASQNKGKSGEREIVVMLQPVVNQLYEAHDLEPPQLARNLMQAARGGFDIAGLDWLALEVKRHEKLAVPAWWAQTLEQAGSTREPVLVYRQNSGKWKVMMHGCLGVGTLARTVPVTVSFADFLLWFRAKVAQELAYETA